MAYSSQVKSVLDEIIERLPEPFNMVEIMAKAADKTPYVVVAFQECERMNILTHEIRRSLKELDLGLKVCTRQLPREHLSLPNSSRDWQRAVAHSEPCPVQRAWLPSPALLHVPLRCVQPDGTSRLLREEFETKYVHRSCFLQTELPRLFSFLKGELTITSDMEELANALFYDNVPESWTRYAYPSLLSLGAWYADLLLRIRVSTFLVKVKA